VYNQNTTANGHAKFLNTSFKKFLCVRYVKFHDDIQDKRKYENGEFISRCGNVAVQHSL